MNWTKFGWQGLTVEIPDNWEIGGLSGDYKSGYLRLDDGEIPRLELKWSKARGKNPDLQKVLDEYFKLVRKDFRKKDSSLNIKRNINLVKDESFSENRNVTFFSWKSDVRANGAIWHCHECKRIVVVQVIGHLKENMRDITLRIFNSISDHPPGYTNLWSAYQLNVEIPRRYRLDKQKLMSGYLLLSFVDGSRTIAVERYGPADVLLKERDLETWFRRTYAKAIAGYGFSVEKRDTEYDERIELDGSTSRIIDKVPMSPVLLVDKVMRRTSFAAQLWHCHKSNRIFAVRVVLKGEAAKIAREVADSIQCCSANSGDGMNGI
ncbi:hypothetical protein FJZ31_32925 [Candidatus Poribacteria bacterium]|nr:hypothetical protein [Candidatus Poribacteria bacterium]